MNNPFFTPAREVRSHVKIFETGDSGAGKTWDFFHMPGPRAAFDLEDGLVPYRDRFDFDLKKVHTIDELNAAVHALVHDHPELLEHYRTVGFDGLTRLWHDAVQALQEDGDGEIEFDRQRDLKGPWKKLNSLVKMLGLHDVSVHAVAHSKIRWRVPGDGGAPVAEGNQIDLDQRLFEPFDLVIHREVTEGEDGKNRYSALVLKSRFGHLPIGTLIEEWNPAMQLERLLTSRPASASTAGFQPAHLASTEESPDDSQRTELKALCERLGSKANGGVLPNELVRRALPLIEGKGSATEARTVLDDIRAAEAEVQSAT